ENKNVGNGKTVNVSSIALSGDDSSNYNLTNTTATTTVDIAKKTLTITNTTANNKTYDSTTIATFDTLGTLSGFVEGEIVTITATGTFDSKNVGERIVTFTYTLENGLNDELASNYSLLNTTTVDSSVVINPKPITVSANDLSKVFGSDEPLLTYTTEGLIGSDSLEGSLQRASGENTGEYTISKGNLANSNYSINFKKGIFTIKKDTTLDSIITPIVNNIIVPKVPTIVTEPTIQTVVPTPKSRVVLASSNTNNPVKVMSSPVQNQNTKMVVMSELKAEQKADAQNSRSDIRVPVGDNSIIELVNGGVNLPVGVDQLLFVVNEKN
ncbi:MAG: MBG domain-containing protein, partial [Aliarcobacter sp.]|nr:MBG domain-containing protein [Aliarcobacter sp.]